MKNQAYFNWSSGKDSALALYKSMSDDSIDILTLFTSINKDNGRVSMHGVKKELIVKQANSINLPIKFLELPTDISMDTYKQNMEESVIELKNQGITTAIFGDIHLKDLKEYRIKQLESIGVDAIFPLWKIETKDIISEFIDLGFKSIITCVNAKVLDKSFVGRVIDHQFINDLPKNVDICGENGEYHSFTFDGPIFKNKIDFEIGEIVYKEYTVNSTSESEVYGYWYCDLIENSK